MPRELRSAVALLATIATLGPSAAQPCGLVRHNVPDLDQRRSAFGNDGSMFCVPTSTANWICYVANHGLPSVVIPNGPADWQSQSTYDRSSDTIQDLATAMGTSPTGGTGGNDGWTGVKLYLFFFANGQFTVTAQGGLIEPLTLLQHMAMGHLVNIGYGRYAPSGLNFYMRTGGHAVSLNGVYFCNSRWTLRYRDPATDSLLSTQSTFTNRYTKASLVSMPTDFGETIELYRLTDLAPEDATYRCLDGLLSIQPHFTLTGSIQQASLITLRRAVALGIPGQELEFSFALPDNAVVSQIAIGIDQTKAFVVGRGPSLINTIYCCDLTDSSVQPWASFGEGPCLIQTTRHGDLVVSAEGRLRRYRRPDMGFPPDPIDDIAPPFVLSALACDDTRDEIVGVGQSPRRMFRCRTAGLVPIANEALPTGVALAGASSLSIDEATQTYFVCGDGSHQVFAINLIPGTQQLTLSSTITAQEMSNPLGLHFTDRGSLQLVNEATLIELVRNQNGDWVADLDSPYLGQPGGRALCSSRSRNNFIAGVHDAPGWNNDPPTQEELAPELPDCEVDFGANGEADIPDIFAALAAWFRSDVRADWDRNGLFQIPDVFAFLADWFRGC